MRYFAVALFALFTSLFWHPAAAGDLQEYLDEQVERLAGLELEIAELAGALKAEAAADGQWCQLEEKCQHKAAACETWKGAADLAYREPELYKILREHQKEADAELRLAEVECTAYAVQNIWDEAQLCEYLQKVHWYVYESLTYARHAYRFPEDQMPWTMRRLNSQRLVKLWPGNPFNHWRGVEIKSIHDGFSAGDLFLQYPPPELTSYRVGATYILGMYGPREDYGPKEDKSAQDWLGDREWWAVAPPGAMSLPGCYAQTMFSTEYKNSLGYS